MSDFQRAIASFENAVRRTVATCADCPDAFWNTRLPGGSIAETIEHMAVSNGLFARRMEAILAAPPRADRYSAFEDDEIAHLFERADEPPGVAVPTGTWTERDPALRRFGESAAPLAALRDLDPGDLRMRGAAHPLFGPMDALQWALFSAAHTERHRSQIVGQLHRLCGDAAEGRP